MSNLPWILAEWHAYSASSSPIKMDGVLFQDIKSIIDVMMKKKEVQVWATRIKEMYDHLADYNNPHKVTVDQMPTKVIDILYDAWRNEGYKGSLEFFIKLLFTYIEVVQFAELMGEDEDGNPNIDKETLIPSVLAVTEYIKQHNESLYVHDPIMSVVFAGDIIQACPSVSFYQFIGLPLDLEWDEKASIYKNIDAFEGAKEAPQEFTLIGGARFNEVNQFLFGIHGTDSEPMYYIYFDWENLQVQLKMRPPIPGISLLAEDTEVPPEEPEVPSEEDPDEPDFEGYHAGKYDVVLCYIDLTPYLENWDEVTDIVIPCALIVDRHHVRLAVWKDIEKFDIAGVFSVIADTEIPVAKHGPAEPKMTIARMDRNDPLYSVVAYTEAMSDDQLLFLMDQHSLPINRTK